MSMKTLVTGGLMCGLVLVASGDVARAQKVPIDPSQRYLLLAAQRTGTMQTELDAAAAQGFRVVASSPSSDGEMVLFLERVTQPPQTYSYRLLATTRTSTMEKELNTAAAEGFRLLPMTAMAQASAGRRILGGGLAGSEVIVVVERAPDDRQRYEYRLLATSRTATMQKEVSDAVAAKFVLVTMLSRDEHMVVMERLREQ
jgi:hypothetical protein